MLRFYKIPKRLITPYQCRLFSNISNDESNFDTHDDFAPKRKTINNMEQKIAEYISQNNVLVFMKGTKQRPMCGFSNLVI